MLNGIGCLLKKLFAETIRTSSSSRNMLETIYNNKIFNYVIIQ